MDQKKFDVAKLTKDQKELAEELGKCRSEKEAKDLLAEKGVVLSDKDIKVLNTAGELDESALESVSGGGFFGPALALLAWIWKCNVYTNWGRNGKHCICGFHGF